MSHLNALQHGRQTYSAMWLLFLGCRVMQAVLFFDVGKLDTMMIQTGHPAASGLLRSTLVILASQCSEALDAPC